MDTLQVRLLGPLQVERNGQPITEFKTDATRALLGLLSAQRGVQRRDVLATRLAPVGKTDAAALKYLRLALDRLRNALHDRTSEPPFLLINRKEIGLADHVWVDLLAFEQLLHEVSQHAHRDAAHCPTCLAKLTEAAAIYQDDVLIGLNFDSPGWQAWLRELRGQKQQQAVDTLTTLAAWRHRQATRRQGTWQVALDAAHQLLHMEAWHEQAHRWAMEAQWQMGQPSAAVAQYEACVTALADELGSEPSGETVTLLQRIEAFADPTSAEIDTPHNLPQARTGFFGRQHELTQLQTMLTDPFYRLVNVVGEGGMGKSRLAQEVGWQLRPSYPDGIWFVRLAGADGADSVVAMIAQALDFTFRDGPPPLQQLIRFLRHAESLLILDNFEHLVEAADILIELLNGTEHLVLLCTSRQMLNLDEEIVLPLRGLEVTARKRNEPLDTMQPAIQLFAARARRADARFLLDEKNGPIIEQIARRLEGHPLGLELAASWARSRTSAQILQAIEESADFLAARPAADVDRRHHTMRAVFETSWQMLKPTEKRLYPKLSLFRGGFSAEAGAAITNATIEDLDILIEKSMVQFDHGRYHVHELLRQYANEQLAEKNLLLTQFTNYYAAYLDRHHIDLDYITRKTTVAQLNIEEANFKQAWRWAVEQQHASLENLSDSITHYYIDANRSPEGLALLHYAMTHLGEDTPPAVQIDYFNLAEGNISSDEIEPPLRRLYAVAPSAACCNLLGNILWQTGRADEAVEILQEAIHRAQAEDMPNTQLPALYHLGIAYQFSAEDDAMTLRCFERGLSLARETKLVAWEIVFLTNLGQLYLQIGQAQSALATLQASRRLAHESGQISDSIVAVTLLSRLSSSLKQYQQAVTYGYQALVWLEETDDSYLEIGLQPTIGIAHLRQGQLANAQPFLEKGLELATAIQRDSDIAFCTKLLSDVAHARSDYAVALAYQQAALQLVGGDLRFEAETRFVMGNTLLAMGQAAEAQQQFEQSRTMYHQVKKPNMAMEASAGVADALWRQEQHSDAQKIAQQVADFVDSGASLFGCEDDLHIMWRLSVVLDAPRWLAQAHKLLMEYAAQFDDDLLKRHAYLHNLPVHRAIVQAFTKIEAS